MRIWSESMETAIKLLGVDVCPSRHAKWSHVHHQGHAAFAWSITSGIISHIMKALVPLPFLLFFHTAQTGFFFQIINYLIPFSLHMYSNTEVAWRLEKLFLWLKGHFSLNLPGFLWNSGWWAWMSTSQPPSICSWATHCALAGSCAVAQDNFLLLHLLL